MSAEQMLPLNEENVFKSKHVRFTFDKILKDTPPIVRLFSNNKIEVTG
jgi:hypothetical protein